MRVYGYDEGMNKIGILDYVQILWNRKNFELGAFTLYQHADDYIDCTYIKAEDRREIGTCYKPTYKTEQNGKYVTVEGKFTKDFCNDETTGHGKTIVSTESLNAQFLQSLSRLGITEAVDSEVLSARDDVMTRCLHVGDEMSRILQLDQESFDILRNENGDWKIRFRKAKDRGIIFSKALGNASAISYYQDMSGYYHTCVGYVEIPAEVVKAGYTGTTVIGGKYYDTESYTSTLSVPERYKRRKLSKDFSLPEGLECTVANKAKIRAQIQQMCKLELLDHYVVRDIEVDSLQIAGCKYMIDYDVGDIVHVHIPEIDVLYEAQIIEADETWEKNQQTVKITIGNKKIKR